MRPGLRKTEQKFVIELIVYPSRDDSDMHAERWVTSDEVWAADSHEARRLSLSKSHEFGMFVEAFLSINGVKLP